MSKIVVRLMSYQQYVRQFCVVFSLLPSFLFAGTVGISKNDTPYFVEIGTGASFSLPANLKVDVTRWSPSPQGYNANMNNAPLFMGGIGYVANALLMFDVNATYRGLYKYTKFQNEIAPSELNPLGGTTRYFDLSSTSVLFNGTLNGRGISERLVWDIMNRNYLQPFCGAGVGISYNSMSNFHTVIESSQASSSVMPDNTATSLAYQLNAGLEWVHDRFSFDVGYRYFNGGTFKSNNYITTRLSGETGELINPIAAPPWKGTLCGNELFFTAKVAF